MACGCAKKSTDIKYELSDSDGNTVGTYDTRTDAQADRKHGGKIRPVRVPS